MLECLLITVSGSSLASVSLLSSRSSSLVWLHFPLPPIPKARLSPRRSVLTYAAPSIDGDLIPDSPHTLLANGQFAQKPYISGNVKDEGTTFVPTAVSSEAQLGLFVNVLEPIAPDNATLAQLLQLYPNEPTVGS
jgi:carboxylesterase type B